MGILLDSDYRMLDYGPHIESNSQFTTVNSRGSEILTLPKEVTFIAEECFAKHTPNIIIVPEGCEVLCGELGVYDSDVLNSIVYYCKNEDSPSFYSICSTYTPKRIRLYLKDGAQGLPMAHFNRDIDCFEVFCNGDIDAFNVFHFADSPESHGCKLLKFVCNSVKLSLNKNMGHDKIESIALGDDIINLAEFEEIMEMSSLLPICLRGPGGDYRHQALLSKIAAGVRCAILTPKSYSTLKVGQFDNTRLNRLLKSLESNSFNDDKTITLRAKSSKELIEFQLSPESVGYNTKVIQEQIASELQVFRRVLKDLNNNSFLVSLLNNLLLAGKEGLINLHPFYSIASNYYTTESEIPEVVSDIILQFESLSYDDVEAEKEALDFEMTQEFDLF